MANKNFKVKNNVQVSDLNTAGAVTVDANGVLQSSSALPVAQGGTGQTTAQNAINALVPSQTSNANKLLGTDGTSVSWVSPGIAYQTSAPLNPVTGQLWVDSDETGDSLDPYIIRRKTITATAGQTVFTTDVTFTDGYEQVYYNGVLLVRTTDYTTSGGTNTVTLLQGASAGDTVEIIASTPINLINTATTSTNTFTGTQTIANSGEWPVRIVSTGATSSNRAHFISQRSNNGGAVTSGFTLGGLSISGHDGTNYGFGWNGGAEITAYASQTWTSSARGTDLVFSTSYANQTFPSERFRITANDTFGFNVSSPSYGIHHRVFGNAEMATQYGTGLATYIGAYAAEGSLRVTGANPLTLYNNSLERMRISSDGNVNIGGASNPGDTLRFFDIYNTNAGNSAGSIIRLITNNAANTGLTTVDIVKYRNGNFFIMNNDSAGSIILSNAGSEKLRIGNANDHVNMGMLRTWNLGQPTANIVSGGANCIRLQLNRSGIYYRGFVFDVYMGGGKDWGGNGFTTYFAKFMVTFTSTTDARVHLIQEYGRSYLNNSGTEITYNTFSYTTDATYMYLNINFKGFNASDGYRPQMSVITYDAGNGGSTSITGANNQVYNVTAI